MSLFELQRAMLYRLQSGQAILSELSAGNHQWTAFAPSVTVGKYRTFSAGFASRAGWIPRTSRQFQDLNRIASVSGMDRLVLQTVGGPHGRKG